MFLNVAAYAFNYWLCIYVLGAFDGTGGSTITHTFGAFFGAACTAVASPKDAYRNPDCKGRYQARAHSSLLRRSADDADGFISSLPPLTPYHSSTSRRIQSFRILPSYCYLMPSEPTGRRPSIPAVGDLQSLRHAPYLGVLPLLQLLLRAILRAAGRSHQHLPSPPWQVMRPQLLAPTFLSTKLTYPAWGGMKFAFLNHATAATALRAASDVGFSKGGVRVGTVLTEMGWGVRVQLDCGAASVGHLHRTPEAQHFRRPTVETLSCAQTLQQTHHANASSVCSECPLHKLHCGRDLANAKTAYSGSLGLAVRAEAGFGNGQVQYRGGGGDGVRGEPGRQAVGGHLHRRRRCAAHVPRNRTPDLARPLAHTC